MYILIEGSSQISQCQQCLDYFKEERLSRVELSDTVILSFSLELEIKSVK